MAGNDTSKQAEGKSLDSAVAQTERLGVVGSPSKTSELAVDVVGTAAGRKLVGELAMFAFQQDEASHYALGQITEVELRNTWHEDPTMRSLIRQRGRVDAVSERQDTHIGKMVISAVFKHATINPGAGELGAGTSYEPSLMGTVPPTGTAIHMVNDAILHEVLHRYRDQIFYLGHVYSSTPKLPLWFKHFGTGPNGAGEAYHLGIFGKTGSGKSVLAKMALCAYMRYPQMGLLVLDPQGEFAKDFTGDSIGEMPIPLRHVANLYGKKVFTLSVRNLVLDRWDLLQQILAQSRLFRELQIMTQDKADLACEQLIDAMRKASGITLPGLHKRDVFDKMWNILHQEKFRNKVYAKEGLAAERFKDAVDEANPGEIYRDIWLPVAKLFREDRDAGRRKVDDALNWLLDTRGSTRPILVVDVSREQARGLFWNDNIQSLVIKRLIEGLTTIAERRFQDGDEQDLNTLVLLDEAHRLAPQGQMERGSVGREVRELLIDAVRTTRKYGLGWLFISQTLSSLHTQILQQLRIQFFGFGLSMGQEFQALRQHVGGDDAAMRLYGLFRDPHSSFDISSRQYSFMTTGPISPLSFSGSPLFLNVFNTVEQFMRENGLSGPDTES